MHVLATAGHVDHGKSTLLRALTGMEPDRWEQERRRGLTIDLGFVWTALPGGGTVAFVDVPGHERFVGTMLAGIGPVPAVLFVVAADEGWKPQSGEHLDALAALGTEHGLLVITRSDLMEPELALAEAREHLAATPLAGARAVCVSATTGAGMARLRTELETLVGTLAAPDPGADVRLWVDRAFSIRGAGTVVTGTLPGGRIKVGDTLTVQPGDRAVTVRGIQVTGRPVAEAVGVARVAVNLRGVPADAVGRGDALVSPRRWLTTTVVDARLSSARTGEPIEALPASLIMHIGAAAVPVRIRPLSGGEARPSAPRDSESVRLTLSSPLPLHIGDRALLRDAGRHRIAAGLTVLDVHPPTLKRRGAAARRADQLASMSGAPDPADELARRGLVERAHLVAMGADPAALADTAAVNAGTWLLDLDLAARLAQRLVAAVTEHEQSNPLERGISVGSARRVLGLPDDQLVEAVLSHAGAREALAVTGGRIHRTGHERRELPAALREAVARLTEELAGNPFAAPGTDRLTGLGLDPKALAALVRAGELEKIAPEVYLRPGAEQAALQVLRELPEREFTVSSARQAWDTSRRVAVPLLELLARHGHTARTTDGRHRLLR